VSAALEGGDFTGGNRRWNLRFGTATHVARRAVPGVLRNFLSSFPAATFTWPNRRVEPRENDGREIGRRRIRRRHGSSSGRLITLGRRRWLDASRVAVIERGRRRQPRAEEDRELMRVCPCVEKRTAEVGESGFSLHDACVLRDPLTGTAATLAGASRVGTPRAHRKMSASLQRQKGTFGWIEKA
jgi:hypothetical protein